MKKEVQRIWNIRQQLADVLANNPKLKREVVKLSDSYLGYVSPVTATKYKEDLAELLMTADEPKLGAVIGGLRTNHPGIRALTFWGRPQDLAKALRRLRARQPGSGAGDCR